MIPKKEIDFNFDFQVEGERQLRNAVRKLRDLKREFGESTAASEGFEQSLESTNREMLETATNASAASGALTTLEGQMIASKAVNEAFDESLGDLTEDAETAERVINRMAKSLDGGFEDATPEELNDALGETLETMMRMEEIDEDLLRRTFMDVDETVADPFEAKDVLRTLEEIDDFFEEDRKLEDIFDKSGMPSIGSADEARDWMLQFLHSDDLRSSGPGLAPKKFRKRLAGASSAGGDWDDSLFNDDLREYIKGETGVEDITEALSLTDDELHDLFSDIPEEYSHVAGNWDVDEMVRGFRNSLTASHPNSEARDWASDHRELDARNVPEFITEEDINRLKQADTHYQFEEVQDLFRAPDEILEENIEAFGKQEEDAGIDSDVLRKIAQNAGIPEEWTEKFLDPDDKFLASRVDRPENLPGPEEIAEAVVSGERKEIDQDAFEHFDKQGGLFDQMEEAWGGDVREMFWGEGDTPGESILSGDLQLSEKDSIEAIRRHMGKDTSFQKAASMYSLFEDMGGNFGDPGVFGEAGEGETEDGRGIPLRSETVRSQLWAKFVNADNEALRQMYLEMFRDLEKGRLGLSSIANTDEFKNLFREQTREGLAEVDIPDELADEVSESLADAFQTKLDEHPRLNFVSDILNDTQHFEDVLDDAVGSVEDMNIETEEGQDAVTKLRKEWHELMEVTDDAARDVEYLFESRAAPRERTATGRDTQPFGWLPMGKDRRENKGLSFSIRKSVRNTLDDTVAYGTGGKFEGLRPMLFMGADRLAERFDILNTVALDAEDQLESVHRVFEKLTPKLDVVSGNLGMLNIRMASMGAVVYGLTALLGPLVTSLIGLASGAIVGTTALASLIGVGALGFFEELEKQMAGVNSKTEAAKELFQGLAYYAKQAIEPLQNANVGGDGAGGIEMFVSVLRRSLDLLHYFSRIMASIVETDEFASFIENVGEALFEHDGEGPTMLEAMVQASEEVFPILEDFFVWFINVFPEFTQWTAKITKLFAGGFGPALKGILPLLEAGIEFGAWFFWTLGKIIGALVWIIDLITTFGDGLAYALNWMTPLVDITGSLGWTFQWLLRIMAVLTGAHYALVSATMLATFAEWAHNKALEAQGSLISRAMSRLYGMIAAKVAATGVTGALATANQALMWSLRGVAAAIYSIPGFGWALLAISLVGGLIAYFFDLEDVIGAVKRSLGYLKYGLIGAFAPLYLIYKGIQWLQDMVDWTDLLAQGVMMIVRGFEKLFAWVKKIDDYWDAFKAFIGASVDYQGNRTGPGDQVSTGGGNQTVNNYNVTVEGGDKKAARNTRRELEKRERRKKNYNGRGGYTPS